MGIRPRLFLADDQSLFLSGLEALLSLFGDYEIAGKARTGADVLALAPGLAVDAILLDIGLPDRSGIEVARELRCMGVTAPILIVSNYDSRHCVVTAVKAHVEGYLLKDADADALRRAVATILSGRRFIDERLLGYLMDELQGIGDGPTATPGLTATAGLTAPIGLGLVSPVSGADAGWLAPDAGAGGGGGAAGANGRLGVSGAPVALRTDAGGVGGPDAARAAGAYGLTRRELDVLRLMASGLSNDEIAKRLFLSPKTARNHTTNIFQKMGVSDRTKAVVMALAKNMVEADSACL